jgi:cytoskeleton protein RodZ
MSLQSGEQPAASDAASSGGYEGVGHSLRVVRERRGLELADVSARLRIRRPYLEAIESGRFAELPGAVYINGFLRQYAEFLGLDAEQVLKTYQDEADAPPRTVLNFPMPRPEDRTPRLWLIGGALIIAIAVYALWYRHQEALRLGHDLIEAVPARLADLVPSPTPIAPATTTAPAAAPPAPATPATPAPVAGAPSTPAVTASAPPSVPPSATGGAAGDSMVSALPNPATQPAPPAGTAAIAPAAPSAPAAVPPAAMPPGSAPAVASQSPTAQPADAAPAATGDTAGVPAGTDDTTAAAGTAPASPPGIYGAPDATDARVRLEATAPAWIQVRGPNNEQIFTRLLRTGERYIVPPDRSGLTLLTGNAGGLKVVVDGQALPPLGATGEVRRGIPLDADKLKAADSGQAGQLGQESGQGSQG